MWGFIVFENSVLNHCKLFYAFTKITLIIITVLNVLYLSKII